MLFALMYPVLFSPLSFAMFYLALPFVLCDIVSCFFLHSVFCFFLLRPSFFRLLYCVLSCCPVLHSVLCSIMSFSSFCPCFIASGPLFSYYSCSCFYFHSLSSFFLWMSSQFIFYVCCCIDILFVMFLGNILKMFLFSCILCYCQLFYCTECVNSFSRLQRSLLLLSCCLKT